MFSWPELFSDKGVDDVVRFADFFLVFSSLTNVVSSLSALRIL